MTSIAAIQFAGFLILLLGLAWPLGGYMARVYEGRATLATRLLGPLEKGLLRLAGKESSVDMKWPAYARAVLLFNLLGALLVYLIQRAQAILPLNPADLAAVNPDVAFNTAVSFASNTNWQAYSGETTMSHFTQMAALTTQNFVSAATGMAVLVALIRGLRSKEAAAIGNFWVDLVRSVVYILLPLSMVLAVVLLADGVPQTFNAKVTAHLLEPQTTDRGPVATQDIAVGPVASQIAIKQLGTNGGGYYNVNSAHPLENPGPMSNTAQSVSILLISAALCFTYGAMIADRRQGIALLAAMLLIFIPAVIVTTVAEDAGSAVIHGPNLEGKEVRFGVPSSALWAVATTAASNGSVNAMHDSFTPLGGLAPMVLMQLGEIVFGGVGSGLYGMLVYVVIAVFLAGLMVGRTPEYLGKKVEAFEMKMATLVILLPSASVLLGTAVASVTAPGVSPLGNPGIHGFSEILYAFSSGANNNGSAFGGLTASGPFYATAIGIAMLIGRYALIVPVLAMAGSFARKRIQAKGPGTLDTHTPLFTLFLVATILLVGALTFLPALALGPIVEHLSTR